MSNARIFTRLLCAAALLCAGWAGGELAAPARAAGPAATVVGTGTPASCTQAALAAALASGGSIGFDCGAAPVTIPIAGELLIDKDTAIDGGGKVTLRGSGAARVLRTADGVFNGTAVLKVLSVTIDGLTIENGVTADQGGAIKVGFWNSFTLRDSALRDNRSTKADENCAGGGAIFIGGGGVARIERASFSGNQASNGGAINSLRSNITILDSSFSSNQATHSAQINQFSDCGGGGAVYIDGARPPASGGPAPAVIQGSTFSGNRTNNHGGGLFVGLYPSEAIQIDRTSFDGNVAAKSTSMASSGTGGAIWYGSATGTSNNAGFTLTNSTLSNNQAAGQGGGLWTSAAATIANVTFYANDATDASITNLEDWRRGNGGALAVAGSAPVSITNATFAANHAGFNGGAVAGGASITVKNTLFAANTTDWPIKIMQHCTAALTDGGGNMQYPPKNPNPNYYNETNCTAAIAIANPQLGALAQNGGPTKTLALPPGSPAVDVLVPAACPAADQRGIARPQGAKCDIGAFELVAALGLQPSFAAMGGPGFTLTVTGAGFTGASKVLWNGAERPTTYVDSATLRAAIPASDLAALGSAPVTVAGSALPSAAFRVVQQVSRAFLPLARR